MSDYPKGAYSAECARTACRERPANYWNPHTQMFYCIHCARKLNQQFARDGLALITITAKTVKEVRP